MRIIFLSFLFVCALDVSAQSINKRTMAALEYIRQGYMRYGFEELKSAAAVNELVAQFFLAVCYDNGFIVEKNSTEAFRLYRRTAERGLPDGMYYLSACYKKGLGVNRDEARCNEWLQRYQKKGGKLLLPGICEIYNAGLKYSENYALNPNSPTNTDINVLAQNEKTVTDITIVRQISKPVKPQDVDKVEDVVHKSDVDQDIPLNPQNNENTFALIIGNENYQDVAKVPNALNDGSIFAEYCKRTLGIPDSNVHLIKDATLNNIKREVNLMRQIVVAYGGTVNLIIYYAGHGVPDESSGTAYLLPIDGYGSDLTTCYSVNELYTVLGKMQASRVVVLLDACFSGSLRGDGMLASARGVAIKAKQGVPSGNMVVLSAAQGDETAYAFNEEGHGLFTYYLLKRLKDSNGNVELGELASYIKDNVVKKSLVVNGKSQTPSVSSAPSIRNDWLNWKLR